jgi:hypothetical protein
MPEALEVRACAVGEVKPLRVPAALLRFGLLPVAAVVGDPSRSFSVGACALGEEVELMGGSLTDGLTSVWLLLLIVVLSRRPFTVCDGACSSPPVWMTSRLNGVSS